MRASVPRPFAELVVREMHDRDVPHFDGWHKKLADGWHLRRLGPEYVLLHGNARVGTVDDVAITDGTPAWLAVTLTNGLAVAFRIKVPRTYTASSATKREVVEAEVRAMPHGERFTVRGLAQRIRVPHGPTPGEVAHILTHGHLAVCERGVWTRRDC